MRLPFPTAHATDTITATAGTITLAGITPDGTGSPQQIRVQPGSRWEVEHQHPHGHTGERLLIRQVGTHDAVYTKPVGSIYVSTEILAIHPGPIADWPGVNWANDVLTRTGTHWATPDGDLCFATGDGTWPLHIGTDRAGHPTHLYVQLHHALTTN